MRLFGRNKSAVKFDRKNSQEIHSHGHAPVVISYDLDEGVAEPGASDPEAMVKAQEEARRRQACLEAYKRELTEADLCKGCSAGDVMMDTFDVGTNKACGGDEEKPPELLPPGGALTRTEALAGLPLPEPWALPTAVGGTS